MIEPGGFLLQFVEQKYGQPRARMGRADRMTEDGGVREVVARTDREETRDPRNVRNVHHGVKCAYPNETDQPKSAQLPYRRNLRGIRVFLARLSSVRARETYTRRCSGRPSRRRSH